MAEQQVQPLHNEKHANTKIQNGINVEFMKTQHLVPVVAHEFARVANEFPMSFVKNNETGTFQAVAMFGLEPGENLICRRWRQLDSSICTYGNNALPTGFS